MIISGSRRFQGFTLVELVAVIVILGVLVATALPKFANLSDSAHEAVLAATGGAFKSSLSIAHGSWVVRGSIGAQNNIGFGNNDLDVNASGWPVSTTDGQTTIVSHDDCVNIWNGLMENPPSVRPFGSFGGPDPKFGSAPSTDYQATRMGPTTCWYVYRHFSGNDLVIVYSSSTGAVLVDSTIGNGYAPS
jgi:prepilin-type N-terminal cleavage/methylation domain-containing protein